MNSLFLFFVASVVLIASICELLGINYSIITYAIQLLFVFICIIYVKKCSKITSVLIWGISFSLFLTLSYLFNNEYGYIEIVKLICYFIIFYTGYCINFKSRGIDFRLRKKKLRLLLSIIIYLPLLLGFYQRLIGELPSSIFLNSNNYVFYGFSVAFLYYTITRKERNSIYLLLVYVLTGSTLGALLAIVLATLIIMRRFFSYRYMIIAVMLGIIGMYAVLNLDLYLFVRIRDTINIATGVFSNTSILDIVEYDYESALEYGEDAANTSFLFRIKHWYDIINMMGNSSLEEWLLGHGDFSLFKLSEAKLPAHNDYLMILFDFGILVFLLIMKYVVTMVKTFKDSFVFIFILSLFIYSITENLYTNFIACQIFYYLLGASYSVGRNELLIQK